MRRISYIILFLLFFQSQAYSHIEKDDSLEVLGHVCDNFTRQPLPKIKIEVLSQTGEVLQVCYTMDKPGNYANKSCNFPMIEEIIKVKRGDPPVILRFSKEGYEEKTVTIPVKAGRREGYIWAGTFQLKKAYQLKEAVVKASKVMMVVKNDTLVYNADAFQLSEGSMLDALVKQLPGVEIEDGGRITVNGEFVSSLLVNGEDFFKGDPRIALENLPAYMVDKVKVYEKEAPDAYLRGRPKQKGENPLVMDVNLKRQYATGWIANAEGGYGTHDRFMGKVFGLRFTDQSRLALFGNLNNVNDTQEPGNTGSWSARDGVTAGSTAFRKGGGMDLLVSDKKGKWKLQGNLKARHEDIHRQQENSGVRFFEGGDVWTRSRYNGRICRTDLSTEHKLEFTFPKFFLGFRPSGSYRHYDNRWGQQSADFNAAPAESYRGAALDSIFLRPGSGRLEQFLINRLENRTMGSGYRWNATMAANATVKIPHTPDVLFLNMEGSGGRAEDKEFGLYDLRYKDGNSDFRNTYDLQPERNRKFKTDASYHYRHPWFWLITDYSFSNVYTSGGRSLYRLDRYEQWADSDNPLMGVLPSTTDEMQQALDLKNSYHSALTTNTHLLSAQFCKDLWKNGQNNAYITLKLRRQTDHLDYYRGTLDADRMRRKWMVEPELFFPFLKHYEIRYSFRQELPSMTDLLDLTDDANPLYLRHGNPGLKNARLHNATFEADWRDRERGRTTDLNLNYTLCLDAIGNAVVYNRQTGVTESTPRNIDGNWNLRANLSHNRPLDKQKRLNFSTNTRLSYNNSVDFASVTGETAASDRSSVRNLNLSQTLRASYRMGKFSVGGKVNADWSYARSPREDFSTISSVDLYYSLTGQVKLPGNVDLSTDLTLYSRRGYDDASMNSDDWVWNARVSKSLLHGNLVLALDGFDILQQLSNVRTYINAQGRTEVRYNTIPNYFMAHVIYRLNIKPKRDRQ